MAGGRERSLARAVAGEGLEVSDPFAANEWRRRGRSGLGGGGSLRAALAPNASETSRLLSGTPVLKSQTWPEHAVSNI